MARPLAPATPRDVARAEAALHHLREARDCLSGAAKGNKAAEPPIAPQALARINAAIKSADGAVRHAQRCADHARRQQSANVKGGFFIATHPAD